MTREGGKVDLNRRKFLKKGFQFAGVAALGAAGMEGMRHQGSQSPPSDQPKSSATPTPALTPQGQVIHVHGEPMPYPMPPPAEPTGRQGVPGRRWVMVIDLAKCDGCGQCTVACGKMHFIPPDRQWIPVLVMQDAQTEAPYFFPRPCFHCDNPPCTKVCPVNATYKTQDGTVLVDNDRCIGCRFCIAGCPYGVRCFNWGHPQKPTLAQERGYSPEWGYPRKVGTVEKCDFCPDMAAIGQLPACTSG